MSTVLSVIALAVTVAGAFMWVVSTLRHRSHISQCAQDLQRHRRLDKRLIGCVSEMERILDTTAAQAPGDAAVSIHIVHSSGGLRLGVTRIGVTAEALSNSADLEQRDANVDCLSADSGANSSCVGVPSWGIYRWCRSASCCRRGCGR